jgi:hypothetical protein
MNIIDKYSDKISGILHCYDRVNIKCSLGNFGYAGGMTIFFSEIKRKCFDFAKVFQPVTDSINSNAERLAKANGLEIEFIRSPKKFRKDDKIDELLKEGGMSEGLFKIWTQMETCPTYTPWHDRSSNKTFFKPDFTKCKVYYFYFIDRYLGLCFIKIPTIAPFTATIYYNGHYWLEKQLQKQNIDYQKVDNAFTHISNFAKAQELCDKMRVEDFHQSFDILLGKVLPLPKEWNLRNNYTILQCEYSLDIIFKNQGELSPIYNNIVQTAMHTITPKNIATFLGKRMTVNFEGEAGNRYNERVLGTRIKHQMDELSVKVYDKFGKVLRIEVTALDVSKINLFRDVFKRNGDIEKMVAPAKKNIYSLFHLMEAFKTIIKRYLEFVSSFDDPTSGIKMLSCVTGKQQVEGKNVKGLNFFDKSDERIILAIADGKFNIKNLSAKHLRLKFPEFSGWKISAILKRLKNLGLIKRIKKSYRYVVTELGKKVFSTGLYLKNQIIIPALDNAG